MSGGDCGGDSVWLLKLGQKKEKAMFLAQSTAAEKGDFKSKRPSAQRLPLWRGHVRSPTHGLQGQVKSQRNLSQIGESLGHPTSSR